MPSSTDNTSMVCYLSFRGNRSSCHSAPHKPFRQVIFHLSDDNQSIGFSIQMFQITHAKTALHYSWVYENHTQGFTLVLCLMQAKTRQMYPCTWWWMRCLVHRSPKMRFDLQETWFPTLNYQLDQSSTIAVQCDTVPCLILFESSYKQHLATQNNGVPCPKRLMINTRRFQLGTA